MNFIDNFNRLKNNKLFNKIIIVLILLFLVVIASFFMLRYQVEGETNLPFILSKIIVISSAEGRNLESQEAKWSFSLMQNNDFYISINKNEEYTKKETIKSIEINNIQINKKQSIGNIKNYKPAAEGLFKTDDQYLITDKLVYTGSTTSNINNLQIGNQGGTILFRSSNTDITTYNSNEDEIIHNGMLLAKAGITNEQIEYGIQFDLTIETDRGIKYKGTININLPKGNILTEERGYIEKTNFEDVIFKRISNV